jgi:hypothetical protein
MSPKALFYQIQNKIKYICHCGGLSTEYFIHCIHLLKKQKQKQKQIELYLNSCK